MILRLIPWLFWKINLLICSTLRYQAVNEPGAPSLFALWHGESFPVFYWAQHRRLCLYPADSWRGEVINYLATKYKYNSIRFTEKGTPLERSENIIKLLKTITAGYDLALAVDGPPPPLINHRAKPGIIFLSQKSGVPIVPVAVKMPSKITLGWRWDKYQIPLPWSKVKILFGRPFAANSETTTTTLEESLARISQESQNEAGRSASPDSSA